jgi:hypothetical protein
MIHRLFRSRFALTLWLVAALLWAPIWGQWHGIAHQVHPVVSVAGQVSDSTHSIAQDSEGHAVGSALCHVLDHLGHASALAAWPVQILLQSLPQAALPSLACRSASHRLWWAVQARAPPVQI